MRPYRAKGPRKPAKTWTVNGHIARSGDPLFWAKVNKTPTCWLWTGGKYPNGYGLLGRNDKTLGAHRYSYELSNGPITGGLFVLHKCDTPLCVRPDHLFLGTPKNNIDDAINKGRRKYKITLKTADSIRERLKSGDLQKDIAAAFGVSCKIVSDINCHKSWAVHA